MVEIQLKEAVRRRWEFIEFCLNWEGSVGRKRLQDTFGISPQQATNDLNGYSDLAPKNIAYDPRQKTYVPSAAFSPLLTNDDPYEYLRHLNQLLEGHSNDENWIGCSYKLAGIREMRRQISSNVLRIILKGIREQRVIAAHYISLTASTPAEKKRIVPQALAFDGHRWHARAYNMEKERFSDYVLSRFESAELQGQVSEAVPLDSAWFETVDIRLAPNPILDADTQKGLEYEYQMISGELVLQVKKAMLFYYLRQYGFNPFPSDNGKMRNESSFNLIIGNIDEVEKHLDRR